ncbi:DNA-binding transcriptional regulator, AcrR family [Amycolatopsis arida]|uniref:DNA-binding transcriptional regulator, AcrR family n=1 Tax=Amycolatopsis arida TaxID=587909 RepID=A0A1I6ASR3_9PSEU|nr:TetR/AcrR family transcriptional regulator [Amycolatopsis arida]TDX97546.1 AcrR family transcriptional regulator [Amycolatopsis arida]SFQ71735.1 DNA-binding transcriptional regulator, AcrR family [Amycolatopsis arida]
MVVYAGRGDSRRAMALLWRTEPVATRPGPKPGLTIDMIVAAAIEVADADGMAGLSMRAVGERLGRTAMALYTYVPNKGELVDLMYDHALGEVPDVEPGLDWRAAVTAWAEQLWRCYLRHPWMLEVSPARPVLGPHEYALVEALVRILRETGLPAGVLRRVVGTLFHVVRGAAQVVAEARGAERETGAAEEDWWRTRAGLLLEVVPDIATRYPALTWLQRADPPADLGPDEGYLERETGATFLAGLGLLLDGIDAAIARAGQATSRADSS